MKVTSCMDWLWCHVIERVADSKLHSVERPRANVGIEWLVNTSYGITWVFSNTVLSYVFVAYRYVVNFHQACEYPGTEMHKATLAGSHVIAFSTS